MSTPLEYLLLMLMSTSQPAPGAVMNDITTAAGDSKLRKTVIVTESGEVQTLTVLSTPADVHNNKLEAPISVPSEWLKHIKVGTPLTLTLHGTGEIIETRISRVEDTVDSAGKHTQGIAVIDNKDGLLQPGMVATATFTTLN